jgi:hypothetical protein
LAKGVSKLILLVFQAISPFLTNEKELYLTKMDLTSAFKKTASLHKRLGSIYTKIGKKNPHYADLVPKHTKMAAANLAAADTANKEAEDLQEKYGFKVSWLDMWLNMSSVAVLTCVFWCR